jgi:predicted PurR-regulated permease PerM
MLGRTAIVVAALAFVGWLIVRAGSELLPFWIGLILAYVTLPLVNRLDRFMPRWLAVIVLLLLELGVVALFFIAIVPPLANQILHAADAVPDVATLQLRVNTALTRLNTLPLPMQEFIRGWIDQVYTQAQSNFGAYLTQAVGAGASTLFNVARSVTFLLGFLVLPSFIVAVLTGQKEGQRAIERALPGWLRPDFWATVRIVDRSFTSYLRGRLIISLFVAALTWAGLSLFPFLGLGEPPYPLAMALFALVFNLIPVVGPVLAALPPIVLALNTSPQMAIAVVLLYVAVQLVAGWIVAPEVENRTIRVNPAILAISIVLASQFGFIWAILAGPIVVTLRDLFRYVYGRMSDPPAVAGVLPGAATAARTTATSIPQTGAPVARRPA